MIVMYAITKGIELVITGLYKLINATNIAIEEGQKAQEKITEVMDTVNEKSKGIDDILIKIGVEEPDKKELDDKFDEIAKEYTKLRSGVSSLNENESLTNDEYQRYLDLSNQIAKTYPYLVKGYDSQNNAILDLGSTVEDATDKLNQMHKAALDVANVEIGENLGKAFKGFVAQMETYNIQMNQLAARRDSILNNLNPFSEEDAYVGTSVRLSKESFEPLRQLFEDNGFMDMVTENEDDVVIRFYEQLADIFDSEITPDQTIANTIREYMASIWNENIPKQIADGYEKELGEVNQQINALNSKEKDTLHNLAETARDYLDSSYTFGQLDSNIQSYIKQNLNNIDYTNIGEGDDALYNYLHDNIIGVLDQLSEDSQTELSKMFELDPTKMNLQDYQTQVETTMQKIFGDKSADYMNIFGLQANIDEYQNKLNTVVAQLGERFGDQFTDEEKMKIITSWNIADVEKAYALLGDESIKNYNAYMKKVEEEVEPPKNDTTFASLFKDDSDQGIKKTIETFKTLNTEIQGYIDSINNGESVNIADIVGAHPEELMKYSDSLDHLLEGLLKMRGDEAEKFAENYSKIVKDGLGRDPSAEEIELAS